MSEAFDAAGGHFAETDERDHQEFGQRAEFTTVTGMMIGSLEWFF